MSERRSGRGAPPRTDRQILAHDADMTLLLSVSNGELTRTSGSAGSSWLLGGEPVRMDLRRLAREDLLLAGFAGTRPPTLLPRGRRLLQMARGELPAPQDD